MAVLVIAEHDNIELKEPTLNTITAASKFGSEVHVLVAGYKCRGIAEAAGDCAIVTKVIIADDLTYEHSLAENICSLILSLSDHYDAILAPADTFGKDFMPRVAAVLDVAQISDVQEVVSKEVFVRPIYAGNALATVQSEDPIKCITIRTTAFEACSRTGGSGNIEETKIATSCQFSKFVSSEVTKNERPELISARIVVSGGRGMQSGDNFQLIDRVADKLGAAVGASRAAVDAGFVPNEYQVGQTGKIVAPEMYVAVGISGAIQHLAGMKDSKIIVAINKDEEAPIFQVADVGLVADLFEALPDLEKELDKIGL